MVSSPAPTPTMPSPYHLTNLAGLALGHAIMPAWTRLVSISAADSPRSPPLDLNGSFTASAIADATQTPPGVYNIRQLIISLSPLLDIIVARLGHDTPAEAPARFVLVEGLAASLSIHGRESKLPLSNSVQDATRREIAQQATRIAETIIRHVQEATNDNIKAHDLTLRSPCEGHLWTPAVASLLLGPRSDSNVMQIYNEWLHRLILLRDALLPFENYEEVPLVIPANGHGIRNVEVQRKLFLVNCLTGSVQQNTIVDLAKVFTGSGLPSGGYGFQYAQGIVLPAFISGSTSRHLLHYHSTRFNESQSEILFDYEYREYIKAPRMEVSAKEALAAWEPSSLPAAHTSVAESSLVIEAGHNSLRQVVKLCVTLDSGVCVSVDLGQIGRGWRYAYEALPDKEARHYPQDLKAVVHSAADILESPGLVISSRVKKGEKGNVHIIPVSHPVLRLALLGKLYPENVILVSEQVSEQVNLGGANRTGKGFSERIVILDD